MPDSDIPSRLAVVGAGSWGTALAWHCGSKGLDVDLWVYEPEVAAEIEKHRENRTYLPGIILPENVRPSVDLAEVVQGRRMILMVAPSHVMRGVAERMGPYVGSGTVLVSAAKGIENDTLLTMTQVLEEALPRNLAVHRSVLSGPSFARELAGGLPTVVTAACHNRKACLLVQKTLSSTFLRVYTGRDVMGVELGGALKNVFAIASGIADGLEVGTNARAALITRALAEMSRLGVHLGANPLTFMGLAGMGDLVLTCTGDLSRNRTVGLKLGRGLKLNEILGEMKMVAEGVKTTRSVHGLARREGVEMPVTEQVFQVLYEDKDPRQSMIDLMTRDLKEEIDHQLGF